MPELIPTPKWITDFYDPEKVKPHYKVEVTEGGFILHEIDLKSVNPYTVPLRKYEENAGLTGNSINFTGTLEDLYKWSCENNSRFVALAGTEFAEVLKNDPNTVVPMMFGFPSTSISMACEVASSYKDFLKIVEEFEANPQDPIVAFKFIDNHPMYWHFAKREISLRVRKRRSKAVAEPAKAVESEDAGTVEAYRIELLTGHGWTRVQVEIIQGKFSFETSGTPYHTQTNYHDYGLDVYSKSMDEGICALAAKIHANYDLEGNLRNGNDEPN